MISNFVPLTVRYGVTNCHTANIVEGATIIEILYCIRLSIFSTLTKCAYCKCRSNCRWIRYYKRHW